MATPQFVCANWKPDGTGCQNSGKFGCKNCLLVVYCGANCQKTHWALHKADCKSPLGKETWKPDWVLKNRVPAFVTKEFTAMFRAKKFLWGTTPAFDVLRLELNEGEDYEKQLSLLFAASADLGSVVKTIAQLPSSYKQPVTVAINDGDIDIVARSVILLLIALVSDNTEEAIDCMIHLWYSTLIRKSDLEVLQRILPLVESVCDKIKGKQSHNILAKTWTFGQRSLRLVLTKSSWDALLASMSKPEGLTVQQANRIRVAVTLAECRKDYLHREYLVHSPSRRVAKQRYRQDGILLPFGSPRNDFLEPNPTMFQKANVWLIHDSADPLHGWPSKDVEEASSGPATADIYGKLFYHLRVVLRAFLLRLSDMKISFQLFQTDPSAISAHLQRNSFSRIEVSNLSDTPHVGIFSAFAMMAPLLQAPLVNPHATIVSLFMNTIANTIAAQDIISDMSPNNQATRRLHEYLRIDGLPANPFHPDLIKLSIGQGLVATYDHVFDRFIDSAAFSNMKQALGVAVKDTHTVIEKWPFRVKGRPGQPGAQEEFDRLIGGGGHLSGTERYVEWRRTGMYAEELKDESVRQMLRESSWLPPWL